MSIRAATLLLVIASILAANRAAARDVILTIGGGYAPSGNQVSLEKNVRFFSEVLDQSLSPGYEHTIYFADGNDPGRDIQYLASPVPATRAEQLLAEVFGETRHFFERYRDHQLPQVAGATTEENLKQWFATIGRKLDGDDRLLIYVTAHGGESNDKRDPYNSTLHLWGDGELTVREFTTELDQLSPELPVVCVMVQCYSGGFSNLIFTGGDPRNGLAPHRRCGFFATTHDRVAAGCTPEINEADYHEYSTSFWAALLGETRTGEPLKRPDFNDDGKTSFAEAHAYVIIHSDTIDLPVKTTDAFLRVYSDPAPERRLAQRDEEDENRSAVLRPVAPLTIGAPVDALLAAADPSERVVINGLSSQLELDQTDRAIAAGRLLKSIGDRRARLRERMERRARRSNGIRRGIEADLLEQWPELAGDWNPAGRQLVREKPEAIIEFIESHPQFEHWQATQAEAQTIEEQFLALELQEVKCERLIQMLESIVLANNLPLVANEELIRRYLALRAAESGTLE